MSFLEFIGPEKALFYGLAAGFVLGILFSIFCSSMSSHAAEETDGRLSSEDREALDQVYISHLKREIERLRNPPLSSNKCNSGGAS